MTPAIELGDVTKRFGQTTALSGVDLTITQGDAYGLIGPNGAGKSTLVNLLVDFVRPTSGTVRVLGLDPSKEPRNVRREVSVVCDTNVLFDRLSARYHLQYVGELHQTDVDVAYRLEQVHLDDAADKAVEEFSTGMKRRLALALVQIGDPSLIVLDEPFSGLDPRGVEIVHEMVNDHRDSGGTVLLSSHSMDHVNRSCDTIGIIRNGRLVTERATDEIVAEFEGEQSERSPLEAFFFDHTE